MIVRNEETTLARCLADAALFVDEIVIVVDTGSTDRTVQVATACGAQVHSVAWQNDYAAARNAAVAQAHGGWILSLDADERLSVADHPTFVTLMASLGSAPAGVVFTTRNYVAEAGVEGWRRNDGTYAGRSRVGLDPQRQGASLPARSARACTSSPCMRSWKRRCSVRAFRWSAQRSRSITMAGWTPQRTREKAVRYAEIGRRKLAQRGRNDLAAVRELAAQEQELGNHAAAIPLWQQVVAARPG